MMGDLLQNSLPDIGVKNDMKVQKLVAVGHISQQWNLYIWAYTALIRNMMNPFLLEWRTKPGV